jgi:hypothetical protein
MAGLERVTVALSALWQAPTIADKTENDCEATA